MVDVADGNNTINSLCQQQIILITYRKFTLLCLTVSVLSHHCSYNNNPILKLNWSFWTFLKFHPEYVMLATVSNKNV